MVLKMFPTNISVLDYHFFERMLDIGVKVVSGSDSVWMHYTMGEFQYEIDVFSAGKKV